MNADTRNLREAVSRSDKWNLLVWKQCDCGSVGFQFDYHVEEEGTCQAKVTTYYRCFRCRQEWSDWERDWT